MRDIAIASVAIVAICFLWSRKNVCCESKSASSDIADASMPTRDVSILDTPHAPLISALADPINRAAGPLPAAIPYNGTNSIAKPPRPARVPLVSEKSLMPDLIKPSRSSQNNYQFSNGVGTQAKDYKDLPPAYGGYSKLTF